jgi:hypothetical protein
VRLARFIGPSQTPTTFYFVGDVFSGMARQDSARGGGHLLAARVVGQEVGDKRGESLRGNLPLLLHLRGPGIHENLGIEGLVVIGRVWIGDKNGGQPELRELAETGRSGSRNHQVGRRIRVLHLMIKWSDKVGNAFPLVIGRGQLIVPLPGEMNNLQGPVLEQRRAFEEHPVNAGSALAASHHQQGAPALIEAECGQRTSAIMQRTEIPADGSPGHTHSLLEKYGAQARERAWQSVPSACSRDREWRWIHG